MSESVSNHARIDRPSEKVTRIDGAHRLPPVEEPSSRSAPPELAAAAAGQSASHVAQQFERQTEQLGRHLRDQSRDLDRRESQLNAHLAQLDSDALRGPLAAGRTNTGTDRPPDRILRKTPRSFPA